MRTAFSGYQEAVDRKVNIFYIDAYEFAHADARSQKQGEDGKISFARMLIVFLFMAFKCFAVFNRIEQFCHFIDLKAQNRFFVSFGQFN